MSDIKEVRALLDFIEKVGTEGMEVGRVNRTLADIASSMAAVATAQESPAWVTALVQAIRGIEMPAMNMPAPVVNVPAPIVNVAAPEMPSSPAPAPPTGWRMRVAKRDDIGRIAEIIFTPEN